MKAIDSEMPVNISGIIGPIIDTSVGTVSRRPQSLKNLGVNLLDSAGKTKLTAMLKPFFRRYDANGDGSMSAMELLKLLNDLGEDVAAEDAEAWMRQLDPNNTGSIEMDEFTDAMVRGRCRTLCVCLRVCVCVRVLTHWLAPPHLQLNYIKEKTKQTLSRQSTEETNVMMPSGFMGELGNVADDDDDDDEEEEMPEEFANLSPEEQQKMILRKAFGMMGFALGLILTFSDPMVEVMSNVGERVGIPPFYVAFVLAPLASNASELIASLAYAGKKTRKTITVSLSALEGAACMNNTFCLAIFMALVYFKQLAWKFSAETIAILIVECLVALIAMSTTMRMWHAYCALLLFPGSIALVALLEGAGYD